MAFPRVLPASAALAALLVAASPPGNPKPRLVSHGGIHTPLVIQACRSKHSCTEWVRYRGEPPRAVVEMRVSLSGRYFYVWSKADGKARNLDFFRVPRAGRRARRLAHLTPGFGGDLHWLVGDFLWQGWGCGAPCVNGLLYNRSGRILFQEVGSEEFVAPDARRVAVLDWSGKVVLIRIDHARAARFEFQSKPNLGFPDDLVWKPHGLRARFDRSTLDCEVESARLHCVKR